MAHSMVGQFARDRELLKEQVHQKALQHDAESDACRTPRLEIKMRQGQELEHHRAMLRVEFDHRKDMLKLEVAQRRLIPNAELEHERALSELGPKDADAVNTGVQDGENTASTAVDNLGPSRTAYGRVQTQLYPMRARRMDSSIA